MTPEDGERDSLLPSRVVLAGTFVLACVLSALVINGAWVLAMEVLSWFR